MKQWVIMQDNYRDIIGENSCYTITRYKIKSIYHILLILYRNFTLTLI